MTYEKLVDRLADETITHKVGVLGKLLAHSELFMVLSIVTIIVLIVLMFYTFTDYKEFKKMKKLNPGDKNLPESTTMHLIEKDSDIFQISAFFTVILTIFVGVYYVANAFCPEKEYTLKQKQTVEISEIDNWLNTNKRDINKYFNTLDKKYVLVKEDDIGYNRSRMDNSSTYYVRVENKNYTLDSSQVYKVNVKDAPKGAPTETFLQYSKMPKQLTYKYPEGKKVNIRLYIIWK